MLEQFSHRIKVIVILQRKLFSIVTTVQSLTAKWVASSCCSASNSDSSPCPSIHRHQCCPTTEDYHTIGSQTLTTSGPFNSRPGRGKPTDCNAHLARSACLRKRGRKHCLAPKTLQTLFCAVGKGRGRAVRDETDADKFRDHWVNVHLDESHWHPWGGLSQHFSRQDDAAEPEGWL